MHHIIVKFLLLLVAVVELTRLPVAVLANREVMEAALLVVTDILMIPIRKEEKAELRVLAVQARALDLLDKVVHKQRQIFQVTHLPLVAVVGMVAEPHILQLAVAEAALVISEVFLAVLCQQAYAQEMAMPQLL